MHFNSDALTGGGEGCSLPLSLIFGTSSCFEKLVVMGPRSKLMAIHPIHGYVIKPQEDLKTIKRNTRERNRVQTVNKGFDTLQRHVPTAAPVKKMSKVCVLQHAMEYIQNLCALLEQEPLRPQTSHSYSHPHHQQQHQSPYPHPHQHAYPHYPRHHPAAYPSEDDIRRFTGYPGSGSVESGYESNSYFSDSPPSTSSWHQPGDHLVCSPGGHLVGSPGDQATSTSSPPPPPKMSEKQLCSQVQKQNTLKPKKKQFGQIKTEKADSTTRREETQGDESSAEEDDVLDAIAEWQEV